ncbi:Transcription factor [Fusarium albosuccineum]|uniref:Transcription factor n=1 Tax=Fusarium albosuccineum TaxID=1237068 RepID=A0A8H4KNT1_9HYPO|nr:Transcription factor [Fusarium albosuccineum]
MLHDSRPLYDFSSEPALEDNRRRANLATRLPSPLPTVTRESLGSAPTVSDPGVASSTMINSPEANSVYSEELSNSEYHGPRSFLSICSTSGVQWVCKKTKGSEFTGFASRLTRDITRRLKIDTKAIKDRTPEPTPELAWKYVTAYFEGAREAAFGLVDRASFEGRLKAHLENNGKNENPAWYALRNAIYATGCRLELSKTGKFRHASQTSWAYFSNSLSVHLELMYFQTTMMAIQALTVMMIDDDQITCLLPQTGNGKGSSSSFYAIALIKLAQMSSLTSKRFALVETQQQSAELLVRIVIELGQKLKTLASHIERAVDLESPVELCQRSREITLQQAIYLRMAYYITVLDVHTPLTYPWSQRLSNIAGNPDLHFQVQVSSDIVVQTARKLVMTTQFVRLDASTSILMGFHGPLYALINMFVHILEDTQRSTVHSDLNLLDIGASHFLRLEFSSESEVSHHFPKELALLARQAVDYKNSQPKESVDGGSILKGVDSDGRGEIPALDNWVGPMSDGFSPSFLDFDFEHCSTFLPIPNLDDYVMDFLS